MMPQGTFPRAGVGTRADPYRPDFSSVETATSKARLEQILSEDGSIITCLYAVSELQVTAINDRRLNAAAINAAIVALEAGTATNAQVQAALAKVIKYLRARHTNSGETI